MGGHRTSHDTVMWLGVERQLEGHGRGAVDSRGGGAEDCGGSTICGVYGLGTWFVRKVVEERKRQRLGWWEGA